MLLLHVFIYRAWNLEISGALLSKLVKDEGYIYQLFNRKSTCSITKNVVSRTVYLDTKVEK